MSPRFFVGEIIYAHLAFYLLSLGKIIYIYVRGLGSLSLKELRRDCRKKKKELKYCGDN